MIGAGEAAVAAIGQAPTKIINVNPNPICPIGMAFNDGTCRKLPDPCRLGTVRVGNDCVALRPDPKPLCPAGQVLNDGTCHSLEPRPDPKPPIVVNNDPCAKLSGGEFRRCIIGTPSNNIPIDKIPGKGPVIGGGDRKPIDKPVIGGGDVRPIVKPIDRPIDKPIGNLGNGPIGNGPTGRVGGTIEPVKPNVIYRPQLNDGPKNVIRDNGPSFKPTTSVQTLPKQSFTQPSAMQPQRRTFIR